MLNLLGRNHALGGKLGALALRRASAVVVTRHDGWPKEL